MFREADWHRNTALPTTPTAVQYNVTGKRFLFLLPRQCGERVSSAQTSDTITAIVKWTAALRRK